MVELNETSVLNELIGIEKLVLTSIPGLDINYLSPPFNNLSNLIYLDLSGNKLCLTEKHENIFKNLTNLDYLNLSYNQLIDLNLQFFIHIINLTKLNLTYIKRFTLKDKLFSNLINLQVLDLSNNYIEMKLNELTFYGLDKLKTLKLNSNNIKHLNGNIFNNLICLIELDLDRCSIDSVDLFAFNGLTNLERLNLANNKIEQISEKHFVGDLINVKQLNLYSNPFIYRTDLFAFYNNLNLFDLDLIID